MTAQRSRLVVFSLWFGSMVFCLAILFSALGLRQDLGFTWNDVFQLATPITSLYIPLLTAFALFWFRAEAPGANRGLSKERLFAALALTIFFQLFMIVGVVGIVLFSTPKPDDEAGLFEHISGLSSVNGNFFTYRNCAHRLSSWR